MKYTVAIILMFVISMAAFAENEGNTGKNAPEAKTIVVTGTVVDSQTGEALTGVNIHIPELDMNTYTDFEGQFSFNGLDAKNYTLQASFISYKEKSFSISQVNGKKSMKVILESVDN